MAVEITMTSFDVEPGGRVLVQWSDGTVREWPSVASMIANVRSHESDRELVQDLQLAQWQARDANLSNKNLAVGKTFTFDMAAVSPISTRG